MAYEWVPDPVVELRGVVLDFADDVLKTGPDAGRIYRRALVQTAHPSLAGTDADEGGKQALYIGPDVLDHFAPAKGDAVHVLGAVGARAFKGRGELTFKVMRSLDADVLASF